MEGHTCASCVTPRFSLSTSITCSFFPVDFLQLTHFLLRMLNTGYSVQEIIEYFKTYVPVKERIARKFKEYKELTEKLKNGDEKSCIILV